MKTVTDTSSPAEVAKAWIEDFNSALQNRDFNRVSSLFAPNGYWRDLLAFTWDVATFQGPSQISAAMQATVQDCVPSDFRLEMQAPFAGKLGPLSTVDAFFLFETKVASGRGFMRLIVDEAMPGKAYAFNFLTTIKALKDYPSDPFVHRRRENTPKRGVKNWLDHRNEEVQFTDCDPDVLIIGAGQAGLALGARLNQLDVKTLIVDKMERVGDNWRKRYHSLTLHNEICTNHLPYLSFPETWPVYIPKDMLAGFMEFYAMSMELNVWTSTAFNDGEFDPETRTWTVRVTRGDGSVRTLKPKNVVMAVGVSGIAQIPKIEGLMDYQGQVVHSSRSTHDLDVEDKTVLVVGAGTSAHDIAQDLHLRGANVTMLQRSSTTVVGLEPASVRAYSLYRENEGKRPISDIDLMSVSIPFDLVRQLHKSLSKQMAEDDHELLAKLREVGFLLDNGIDDTGFFMKLLRSLSGYYINVGASDLIVEGKIKLKSGVGLERMDASTCYFTDGSSMHADMVVMATGYQPLQEAVRALFGNRVANDVGEIWGIGSDGELRNMWVRTRQDGLYIAGGTLTMCRFYSQITALLIKADLEGLLPKEAYHRDEIVDSRAAMPAALLTQSASKAGAI